MTGRGKSKRKALHRGLDDIVNRDASLTSKLLGRVKPPQREPLETQPAREESAAHSQEPDQAAPPPAAAQQSAPTPVMLRPRPHGERAEVRRLDEARAESKTRAQDTTSTGEGKSAPSDAPPAPLTFEQFEARWGFVLRSGGRAGKLRICQILYENTYAAGRETFFTSYDKLARLAGLEKKQCAINIKQLEGLGFVERLNIYNTATRQGTEFKLHLEQLAPDARKSPRHHYYDEDLPQ